MTGHASDWGTGSYHNRVRLRIRRPACSGVGNRQGYHTHTSCVTSGLMNALVTLVNGLVR